MFEAATEWSPMLSDMLSDCIRSRRTKDKAGEMDFSAAWMEVLSLGCVAGDGAEIGA